MKNLPVRMARWSAGHPWRAIAAWFLFVALCLGMGTAAGGHAATTKDFWIGEAGRAEAMATQGGLQQKPVEHVLITEKSGAAGSRRGRHRRARDVADRMRDLPEVRSVTAPVRSADGTAVRVDVTMKGAELDGRSTSIRCARRPVTFSPRTPACGSRRPAGRPSAKASMNCAARTSPVPRSSRCRSR